MANVAILSPSLFSLARKNNNNKKHGITCFRVDLPTSRRKCHHVSHHSNLPTGVVPGGKDPRAAAEKEPRECCSSPIHDLCAYIPVARILCPPLQSTPWRHWWMSDGGSACLEVGHLLLLVRSLSRPVGTEEKSVKTTEKEECAVFSLSDKKKKKDQLRREKKTKL